ncbi:MAG: serine--tRNA ligase, partial [Oscillospiraceae bacterium]|nr:serine--tRNA ligase [Oscillospiraceae bacterium]
MLDIKFLRTNPDIVKENIKKKFQDEKLPLVDEVIELDKKSREAKQKGDELRSQRKALSKQIGKWIASGEVAGPEEAKARVAEEQAKLDAEMEALGKSEAELDAKVREIMMVIPNIIDPSVPIGKDD